MLYGLLVTAFILLCFLLLLFILIQKSKGSLGLGSMGGGTQMLFGGSGGQDFFQKATWAMGALFMVMSLTISLMKSSYMKQIHYQAPAVVVQPEATPSQAAE